MDDIKNWAFSICSASICGAIMNIILPEGSTQKIFKSVFCVFFLCCVVSPLFGMDIFSEKDILNSFDFEYKEEEGTENKFYESSIKAMEDEIRNRTEQVLKDNGIDFTNISLKINILEDGGIEISEFSVFVYSDIAEEIKEKIGNETGLIPEVKILGESF